MPLTDSQRLDLMRQLYTRVKEATESFEQEDLIGADLAYLFGAILNDTCCAWPEHSPLVGLLRASYPPHYPIWKFITLEKE